MRQFLTRKRDGTICQIKARGRQEIEVWTLDGEFVGGAEYERTICEPDQWEQVIWKTTDGVEFDATGETAIFQGIKDLVNRS